MSVGGQKGDIRLTIKGFPLVLPKTTSSFCEPPNVFSAPKPQFHEPTQRDLVRPALVANNI
jgi:hypothetical protein